MTLKHTIVAITLVPKGQAHRAGSQEVVGCDYLSVGRYSMHAVDGLPVTETSRRLYEYIDGSSNAPPNTCDVIVTHP